MSERVIPEDLQVWRDMAIQRPNEYMGSAPFYNRKFVELIERIADLQAKLEEMTQDRNLWQGEHNEDCPNLAHLSALQQSHDRLLEALQELLSATPQEECGPDCNEANCPWMQARAAIAEATPEGESREPQG